jgi:hypothetical protein
MRTQLTSQHGNFVEQILRDAQGQLVRVTFYVYQSGDRVRARVVKAVVLEAATFKARILALGGKVAEKVASLQTHFTHSIVSMYFNFFSIYLSGSKPRAPTF